MKKLERDSGDTKESDQNGFTKGTKTVKLGSGSALSYFGHFRYYTGTSNVL